MSYFDDAFDEYILKNRSVVDDGEGGFVTNWVDGATIQAALDLGSSREVREAKARDLKTVYTATFPKNTPVRYGDYIESVETGEIFRITSEPSDNQTPEMAKFQSCFATAERVEFPR